MRRATAPVFRLLLLSCAALAAQAQTAPAVEHLFQQALDAQKHADFESAVKEYRELLKSSPRLLPAWVNLGVSLVQTGRFPEAVQSYQTALALDPKNRQVQFYLGLAYFKAGDALSASRQFEALLGSEPKDIRAATLLAASDMQSGNNARALQVLEPLAEAAGSDRDFLWALATAQIANGKISDGVNTAEQFGGATNSAEAWKLAGDNRLRLNQFPQAKDDLEKSARINQSLSGLQTSLGQAREKNADYAGAVQAFGRAVEQNAADFAAWLGLGSDQYFTRDLDAARTSLQHALALEPESAPALYALALVDKSQGKPDAAIAGLERVVKILPAWIEAHVQLAALYMQARRFEDGSRERQLVDKLNEDERQAGPAKYQ